MPTFHVWYKWTSGWVYELWPTGENEADAVAAADDVLEYVERIGIPDYLNPDGVTVRPPAELAVTRVEKMPPLSHSIRITSPEGRVTER